MADDSHFGSGLPKVIGGAGTGYSHNDASHTASLTNDRLPRFPTRVPERSDVTPLCFCETVRMRFVEIDDPSWYSPPLRRRQRGRHRDGDGDRDNGEAVRY